jgi:putative ABC transport system ATP-binding protein
MTLEPTTAENHARQETAPITELRGVTKTYPGASAVMALRDLSLTVRAGEFVAIMGRSGSGKSTLLNLLGLLDRPTAGSLRLHGEEVGSKGDDELARLRREKLGFIFQSFNLFARATALNNVAMTLLYAGVPVAERRRRAEAMLRRVGLADRAHHLPSALSGGQQQRVAIARALVNDPVMILADEPTGNLDSRTGESVLALLQELNEGGATILMVTHDEDIARHTGRIVRLFDGEIREDRAVAKPLRAARAL